MTSTTAAYRKDLAAHGGPFGERDGDWIIAGSLVERAANADPADAGALLEAAAKAAIDAVGELRLTQIARREWASQWSGLDPLTLLAIEEFNAGARNSSAALLDFALVCFRRSNDLALGRMLGQRARIAFQGGDLEVARDLYGQVGRVAKSLDSLELRAREIAGEAGMMHLSGNLPRYRVVARRFLELATASGIPLLIHNAHYAVMTAEAIFKSFDAALFHGWELFRLSEGNGPDEARALQALGQLLLDMGDHQSARAALAAATQREATPNFHLGALGGLAVAAARTHDLTLVEWATRQIAALRGGVAAPFAVAIALFDAAVALGTVGRLDDAMAFRSDALNIATSCNFHEIVIRAEALTWDAAPEPARPAPVGHAGERIVQSLRQLEPKQLPTRLRLSVVGA
jgi:tetratricopeptide (TPR) repeat protein